MSAKKPNGELKIEKGIPIPARASKYGAVATLLQKMQVGESLKVPGIKRVTANQHSQRYLGKGKYSVRHEGNGFRIWRTA